MRKLSLKSEHLAELSTEELQMAVGGTFTGAVGCILSIKDPCLSDQFVVCVRDLVADTLLCA